MARASPLSTEPPVEDMGRVDMLITERELVSLDGLDCDREDARDEQREEASDASFSSAGSNGLCTLAASEPRATESRWLLVRSLPAEEGTRARPSARTSSRVICVVGSELAWSHQTLSAEILTGEGKSCHQRTGASAPRSLCGGVLFCAEECFGGTCEGRCQAREWPRAPLLTLHRLFVGARRTWVKFFIFASRPRRSLMKRESSSRPGPPAPEITRALLRNVDDSVPRSDSSARLAASEVAPSRDKAPLVLPSESCDPPQSDEASGRVVSALHPAAAPPRCTLRIAPCGSGCEVRLTAPCPAGPACGRSAMLMALRLAKPLIWAATTCALQRAAWHHAASQATRGSQPTK